LAEFEQAKPKGLSGEFSEVPEGLLTHQEFLESRPGTSIFKGFPGLSVVPAKLRA
jgi:hypothetical protein